MQVKLVPSSIKTWTHRQRDMDNPTDAIASNNQNIFFVNLFLSHDTCYINKLHRMTSETRVSCLWTRDGHVQVSNLTKYFKTLILFLYKFSKITRTATQLLFSFHFCTLISQYKTNQRFINKSSIRYLHFTSANLCVVNFRIFVGQVSLD